MKTAEKENIEMKPLNTRITKEAEEKINIIWDILQRNSDLKISKQTTMDFIINKAYKKVIKEQKKKQKG